MSQIDPAHPRELLLGRQRPEIPAETKREVFIEAGHRCAACGTPFPLERAHIIPWCRSEDHSIQNLICLCANCHERADKDWDEATLREYKRRPWVNRQYNPEHIVESSHKRETLVITIQLQLPEFDEKTKQWFLQALASFLEAHPKSVEIQSVAEGSVRVFVRMAADAAARLLQAYAGRDPELQKHMGDLVITDIRNGTKELIASRAYYLWLSQGCPQGMDLELWLQAEREIVEGERLERFMSAFSDLECALVDVRKSLAETTLQGAGLSDLLVQRILVATRQALRRFAEDSLEVDLFGIDAGDESRWASVAVPQTDFPSIGKFLFYEFEDTLLRRAPKIGLLEDLANRGMLSAEAVRNLQGEGIRAVAVWPVGVVGNQNAERPVLVLFVLSSRSTAFSDSLVERILEYSALLLGLVIEIGLRDESRAPGPRPLPSALDS